MPCFPGIWPLRAAPLPALPCSPHPGLSSLGVGGRGQGECGNTQAEKTRGQGSSSGPEGRQGGPARHSLIQSARNVSAESARQRRAGASKPGSLSVPRDRQDPGQMWPECPSGGCPAPCSGPPESHLQSHARASHAKAEVQMGPWRGTCAATLAWVCVRYARPVPPLFISRTISAQV